MVDISREAVDWMRENSLITPLGVIMGEKLVYKFFYEPPVRIHVEIHEAPDWSAIRKFIVEFYKIPERILFGTERK